MELDNKLITIAKKILNDFGREFFEDTFKVFSAQEIKDWGHNFSFSASIVFVDVPDEQFGGQSPFSICFKDETMEPFMFHDFGAPGRTPYLSIIKKSGKYVIGDVWENE